MRRSAWCLHPTVIRCPTRRDFRSQDFEKFDGKDDYFCFHAGTKPSMMNGTDRDKRRTCARCYGDGKRFKGGAAQKLMRRQSGSHFENKYMRHDIGKAIDEA